MSAEQGTDLGVGQAVPSLNNRGNDEFASLIGDTSGGQQSQQQQQTESTVTKHEGTAEKPVLEQTTPKKAATDTTTGAAQQATTGAAAQPSPGLDKAVLDQIVETATRAATSAADASATKQAAAQVKQDKKDLTPAEFNAKYHIEPITEAHMQAILDADPKKGAQMLNQLLIKNMSSAVLMAKDVIEHRLGAMREEMNPHVTSWQTFQREQREAKLESDFYTSNKDLVNEKPLVKEMQDAIFGRIASGQLKPFATPQDALKAVADATRAVLTRMGKTPGAVGTTQQSQQSSQSSQQTHTRQMTAASSAGQSGAGTSAGQSDVEKIFGNDYV
jgi:hypothetical protein